MCAHSVHGRVFDGGGTVKTAGFGSSTFFRGRSWPCGGGGRSRGGFPLEQSTAIHPVLGGG